ncbi:MAG: hypothetical protein QM811_27750 [Pirellulales bacterium]
MRPRAVWLGNANESGFAEAFARLRTTHDTHVCRDLRTLEAWTGRIDFAPPDLAIVVTRTPDEWSRPRLTQAVARWPLTRWFELLGDWLRHDVHEPRNAVPLERIRTEELFVRLASRRRMTTETSAERILSEAPPTLVSPERILVASHQLGQLAPLADWIASFGYVVRPIHVRDNLHGFDDFPPDVVIASLCERVVQAQWLKPLRETFAEAPLILLIDFPRDDDHMATTGFGHALVYGKPIEASVLQEAIERALRREALACR